MGRKRSEAGRNLVAEVFGGRSPCDWDAVKLLVDHVSTSQSLSEVDEVFSCLKNYLRDNEPKYALAVRSVTYF